MTPTRFDRLELKYVIDAAQRRSVCSALAGRAEPDAFGDAAGRYPVISQYYDNDSHDLFWERERGLPSRRKLRIRLYGGGETGFDPACFVEVKHNHHGRVVKRRAQLPIAEAVAVCEGRDTSCDVPDDGRRVIDEVRGMVVRRKLRPAVMLRYERQAFRGDERWPDLRVTFDDTIVARGRDLRLRPGDRDFDVRVLDEGLTVLEVKVDDHAPRWLADAVAAAGCLRQSHSKYGRSMSALHPELPAQPAPFWPTSNENKTSPTIPLAAAARPSPAVIPVRSRRAWTR